MKITNQTNNTANRAFVIVLNYETEQEAAEELARRIVDTWKK